MNFVSILFVCLSADLLTSDILRRRILVIRDIPLLIHSEGLRVILQTLSDGPHDLSPYLALGFLWVMDRPGTRDYLRPGVDIEVCTKAFLELIKY